MRGSIIKRGDGYSIVITLPKDGVTGKREQRWYTALTKRDAEAKLATLLHEVETGGLPRPSKTTFGDFAARWLQEYATPSLSPKTVEGYESIVRTHLLSAIGNVPLSQVKPEHLQKLYAEKLAGGSSARTCRYIHVTAHVILHTAQKWGLLSRNVADGVTAPKQQRTEMHVLDEDGIQKALEAARSTPYFTLVHLLLFPTGLRRSEALALRWSDVDLLTGQVSVSRSLHHGRDGASHFRPPKTAKARRTVALPPSACMVLREHRESQGSRKEDGLVFARGDGSPMLPDSVSQAWAKLAERLGYPEVRLHDLRHTHASLMLKQGVHPKVVQERLGHSSITLTLDTYSHVAPGLQEAAALRFDDMVRLAAPDSVD